MARRVFISVADPSADVNAALVVGELKRLWGGWGGAEVQGVGGPAMAQAGVTLLRDTVAGSAMGLSAVLRAREVQKLLREMEAHWQRSRPDLVICCDSWSMNVHVAIRAKRMGIPVLYYIAPQAWASRPGRARTLGQVADRVACILPFEPSWFAASGGGGGIEHAEFVGHPLWDRIRLSPEVQPDAHSPIVAVLPGSRRGVTRANWPRLLRVMHDVKAQIPAVRYRIPLTRNAAAIVRGSALPEGTEIFEPAVNSSESADGMEPIDAALPGCSMALCVSGTAALHVAAHGVPPIVVYHVNPLVWNLVARWVVTTRTYSLVNLLSGGPDVITQGHAVAPEFIPWYGSVSSVTRTTVDWLSSPEELSRRREAVRRVVAPLAKPGASHRVAEIADEMLQRR